MDTVRFSQIAFVVLGTYIRHDYVIVKRIAVFAASI